MAESLDPEADAEVELRIAEAAAAEENVRDRMRNLYRTVFVESSIGSEVLDDLRKLAGQDHSIFHADNMYQTAYNNGLRDFYLHIEGMLKDRQKDMQSETENKK